MRNISAIVILIAHALHDHIVHFYHLSALDWVDITTIPKADAARAASIAEGFSELAGELASRARSGSEQGKRSDREWPARNFLSRLLGPSGNAVEP